jgi:hypothetical protein
MYTLRMLKDRLYPAYSKHFSRATLVEGLLRDTDQPFRCLFVDNSSLKDYLLHKVYTAPPRILREWRLWLPRLNRLIEAPPHGVDLCIAVVPLRYEPYLERLYAFKSHEHVHQAIDLTGSWAEMKTRFHETVKEAARRIRKYGFYYRISHDLNEYDMFYNRMYLPHIEKQFGMLSHNDSYRENRDFFFRGFLLFVLERDQAIAGALCFMSNGVLTWRRTGVLDGDRSYIRRGAQAALYHFLIQVARDMGCHTLDLMKSRSFLNDGVYLHKRDWGAAVSPDDEAKSWVYFFPFSRSHNVARFFKRMPPIVYTHDGLRALVGIEEERELSTEERMEVTHRFHAPGLEGLLLLTPNSEKPMHISFRQELPS